MGLGQSKSPKLERKEFQDEDLYAELISRENIPPIKVYLNRHISSSAVESLKDSEALAMQLAKQLVIETLTEKEMPNKFGELLRYIFAYESIRQPTRWLVYWSLNENSNVRYMNTFTRWQLDWWMQNGGVPQVGSLCDWWLRDRQSREATINPLLKWTLRQRETVVNPTTAIVVSSLPYAKVR